MKVIITFIFILFISLPSFAGGVGYINYDKVICFGDNVNDIPMFELADESYATSNAADEIKKIATDVIGSCEEEGVAEFLKERFQN